MVPDSALNEFIARIAINCISNTQYDSSKFTSVVQTFETPPYISLLRWNLRVHELNKLINVFMLHGHLEIGALSALKRKGRISLHTNAETAFPLKTPQIVAFLKPQQSE